MFIVFTEATYLITDDPPYCASITDHVFSGNECLDIAYYFLEDIL